MLLCLSVCLIYLLLCSPPLSPLCSAPPLSPSPHVSCRDLTDACLAHQTIVDTRTQGGPLGKGQRVRLWKMKDAEEFQKWLEQESAAVAATPASRQSQGKGAAAAATGGEGEGDGFGFGEDGEGDLNEATGGTGGGGGGAGNRKGNSSNRIYFLKQDLFDNDSSGGGSGSSSGGAMGNVRIGAIVNFDLCVDKLNGTKVASNIRVSDDPVSDGTWPQVGVIEYLKEGGAGEGSATVSVSISGYIRTIPNDEKLPFTITLSSPEVCSSLPLPLCLSHLPHSPSSPSLSPSLSHTIHSPLSPSSASQSISPPPFPLYFR
jgi:hypothetical protein